MIDLVVESRTCLKSPSFCRLGLTLNVFKKSGIGNKFVGSLNSYIRSSVGSIFFLFPMKVAECTAQTELLH